MQLTIDEKRILLRLLGKIKPITMLEVNLVQKIMDSCQYEIDSEQAAIMFPFKTITYLPRNILLKAA